MRVLRLVVYTVAAMLAASLSAEAKVVGMNPPAQSITAARIAGLPQAQRGAWLAYLKRSEAQRATDKAELASERTALTAPPPPPLESHIRSMPLDKDAAWYATAEARHTADVIVSFQTPAGGWGKNQDFAGAARLPGQRWVPDNLSKYLAPDDFDTPKEPDWNYVGTLDNDATSTQMHFLADVIAATPGPDGDAYRQSYERGIRYLLNAQFPNGGWPQVWPLEGGYHDAITYNDNAVTEAAEVLTELSENKDGRYDLVPPALRRKAGLAVKMALACILRTQIVAHGKRTIWAQQYDAVTLKPTSARNFEPPLPSSDESADLLLYLMSLPHPSAMLKGAVRAGVAWLERAKLMDYDFTGRDMPDGRKLVASPGSGPIWARFYSLDMQPRFADRDKTIHDDVDELTKERRNGYSWYVTAPQKAIAAFAEWSKQNP